MRIDEVEMRHKAGVIPYYTDKDGTPRMMFMIPSNPKFGGSNLQIAKGAVEIGESTQQAAMREAQEELGLVQSNIAYITKLLTTVVTGLDETYNLSVYIAEVRDPTAFTDPHFETGYRGWHTLTEFKTRGRQNQLNIVSQANTAILKQ